MCILVLFRHVCLCGKELTERRRKEWLGQNCFPYQVFAQCRDCFPSGGNRKRKQAFLQCPAGNASE